ncbi:hypothetical protein Tco_1131620 [Tanacetum coccineum]
MRTRSASRPVYESRGGGTGRQVGKGGGRGRGPREQLQNLLPAILAEVGNQGNVGNQNDNVVNENFMMIEEFCLSHEMQKLETELWNHAMVGAGHAAYTDRFHELARRLSILVTYYDEAVRNGSIKKVEKRGNVGEPSKDKNGRDDNKRTRTGNAFATTANPVGRENTGAGPVNVNPVNVRNPTPARGACHECGSTDHLNPGVPRFNRAQERELVVMIGMDWLSNHKAEIIYHEKVVRIPLLDGKVLRVLGERPKEKARLLMSIKASDKKQGEIIAVRDFLEVFLDNLSGFPPLREIGIWIELIPGAVPIVKSPYRLAPSELEELSGQLKEL